VHWDDNEVLFTTNFKGQLDDIKIERDADYFPLDQTYAGLVMSTRVPSGQSVYCYKADGSPVNGYGAAGTPPDYFLVDNSIPGCISNYQIDTSINDTRTTLADPSIDGYKFGDLVIQGVRTYDPAIGTWTAPDAYAGDVHDPLSQKPYVWNRDNPIAYSDPSGFCPFCAVVVVGYGLVTQGIPFLEGVSSGFSGAGVGTIGAGLSGVRLNAAIGKAAESMSVQTFKRNGYEVVGSQVSFRSADGTKLARFDHLVTDEFGKMFNAETKANGGTLTKNQQQLITELLDGSAIPVGKNAAEAGLRVGKRLSLPTIKMVHVIK